MNSIFHFYKSLVEKRKFFLRVKKLDEFPFDESMLSSRSIGIFPDMAIKLKRVKSLQIIHKIL
jgi:hypothetical protein